MTAEHKSDSSEPKLIEVAVEFWEYEGIDIANFPQGSTKHEQLSKKSAGVVFRLVHLKE